MTIAVGLYRDRVLLDEQGARRDQRHRLSRLAAQARRHRRPRSNSRFITGIYDLVFAYEGGDRKRPRLAAGVALRGALRMFFTYRGSMFWRMRSGMGDAVFAPLYKVMLRPDGRRAGRHARSAVKFHFLPRADATSRWRVEQRPAFVTELTFTATAATRTDLDPRDAALDHFGCWPDERRVAAGAGTPSRRREPVAQGRRRLRRGDLRDRAVMTSRD